MDAAGQKLQCQFNVLKDGLWIAYNAKKRFLMHFVDSTSVPSSGSLKHFYFFHVFQILVEQKSLNSLPFV